MRLALTFVCITLGAAGCAMESSDPTGTGSDDVVAGTLDWTHPAVGSLGECSATLVTSDAVVTASGCTGEAFVVHGASGKVAGTYAIASKTEAADVVLYRLAEPVPASIASPIAIATALPDDGAKVTAFGYGCASQRVVDARKRSAPLTWQSASQTTDRDVTCPGAPGASLLDGDGRVVAIRGAGSFLLVAARAEQIVTSMR